MLSLPISAAGVSLRSFRDASSKSAGGAVPEAFGLTLSDSVMEDMIKCFRNGKEIQLSLGEHPNICYGTKSQHLVSAIDPFTHELFRTSIAPTDPSSSPSTMAFIDRNGKRVTDAIVQQIAKVSHQYLKPGPKPSMTAKPKAVQSTTPMIPGEPGLAELQATLAQEHARKEQNTVKVIPLPSSRKTAANKKLLSNNRSLGADATRSMPASPALSGVGSPALGPTTVPLSQQKADREKAARKPIIHLLALEPMSKQALKEVLPNIASQDFELALEKVGDKNNSGKFELAKKYYKELDIWTYNYTKDDDRQRAIENAVKVYDKMRLGVSEPEWERLLPKHERGTGKCLSRLQASIAQGVAKPPRTKVQKDEGSGRDTSAGEEEESSKKHLSKVKGGDSTTRSVSQPPVTKKKASESAQSKRLFSKNAPKAAVSKTTPKTTAATATKKEKAPTKEPKAGTKVLSSEFVEDSDEDDVPPPHKPLPKPVAAKKRARDEEETSDSSIPLSKKGKKDPLPSHKSQPSRTIGASNHSSSTIKSKGTSPQKSSPLASSPPTNASEFDNTSGNHTTSSSSTSPAPYPISKGSRSPIHKRHHKSSSVTSSTSSNSSSRYLKPEVVNLARRYKLYYPKYEALHREVANLRGRDPDKEQNLLDMHERLAAMKRDINAGVVEI